MILSDSHFLQVAFKSYDNPKIISTTEFDADLKRFGYLNTMLLKYAKDKDDVKLRTCVNHVVILRNCFCEDSISLIRYKIFEENKTFAETIMYFLKMTDCRKYINLNLLNKLEQL
jgi:hypothetical protein